MWVVITLYERFPVDVFGPFKTEGDAEAFAAEQEFDEDSYVTLIITSP